METIKLIVDKLSQYNFLTNILPGTVLCILLKYVAGIDCVITADWYLSGIIFYFVGIVNNRFSSLVVELILKKCKIVKFVDYSRFLEAEKIDRKVTILSNENNVFRAYISVAFLTTIGFAYQRCLSRFSFFVNYGGLVLQILICALFVFSYKKQTRYVTDRVNMVLRDKESK